MMDFRMCVCMRHFMCAGILHCPGILRCPCPVTEIWKLSALQSGPLQDKFLQYPFTNFVAKTGHRCIYLFISIITLLFS
ncbi:hypothetical protein ABFS82_07G085100 [Erythranthe guttata]